MDQAMPRTQSLISEHGDMAAHRTVRPGMIGVHSLTGQQWRLSITNNYSSIPRLQLSSTLLCAFYGNPKPCQLRLRHDGGVSVSVSRALPKCEYFIYDEEGSSVSA